MAAPAGTPRAFTAFRSLVSSIHLEPESESNDDNPLEDGEVGDSSSPTKLPQSVYVDDSMDRDVRRKVRSNEKRAERKAEQRAEQEANGELPKPERNPRDPAMVEIDGLLLPDTIRLNDHDAEGNEIEEESVGSVEGVHFVDDDHVMGTRYYDDVEDDAFLATADQAALCRRCKKPGHKERDCPHIVCLSCGAADQHETSACPFKTTCFACGKLGHTRQDCPDPKAKRSRGGCRRCGVYDHTATTCPLIWRVYVYLRTGERERLIAKKAELKGWEQEAAGGNAEERWCYNCAEEGHLGEDCRRPRGTKARAIIHSAFSDAIASRGPYPHSVGTGVHTRWDDDGSLPFVAEGFKGANAGKKTAEKERQRARDADRRDHDRMSTPNRRDDRDRDRGRNSWFDRRGWDSDRRRSRSPPRRGRGYDSDRDGRDSRDSRNGGGRLAVGNITGRSLLDRITPGADSPSGGRGKGGGGGGESLLRRALGDGQRGSERNLEKDWRASGAGGGNVSGWGAEMDRMEREGRGKGHGRDMRDRMSDDRPRAGPARPSQTSRTNRGQRYTGGY